MMFQQAPYSAYVSHDTFGCQSANTPLGLCFHALTPERRQAEQLHREALQVIGFIAGHIDREDLRAAFLGQPGIRAVISKSADAALGAAEAV